MIVSSSFFAEEQEKIRIGKETMNNFFNNIAKFLIVVFMQQFLIILNEILMFN
jgi:hypothetical protein